MFLKTQGTQEQISQQLGITKVTVSRYVTGERDPSMDFLKAVADMGCNLTWLFTGEGEMLVSGSMPKVLNSEEKLDLIRRIVN